MKLIKQNCHGTGVGFGVAGGQKLERGDLQCHPPPSLTAGYSILFLFQPDTFL